MIHFNFSSYTKYVKTESYIVYTRCQASIACIAMHENVMKRCGDVVHERE